MHIFKPLPVIVTCSASSHVVELRVRLFPLLQFSRLLPSVVDDLFHHARGLVRVDLPTRRDSASPRADRSAARPIGRRLHACTHPSVCFLFIYISQVLCFVVQ